jgi:WD40 repeat protein
MSSSNNNEQDEAAAAAAQDGEWTIEPEFLNPDEVEEVVVVDEVEPMDDDDDDDDDDIAPEAADATNNAINLPDLSNVQIRSHSGPVYCVAAAVMRHDESSNQLLVVSGGGDDRAYLHQLKQDGSLTPGTEEAAAAAANATAANVVAVESTLLSHEHSDTVSCVAHNLHGNRTHSTTAVASPLSLVAVGGYDGAIVVYDAVSLQQLGVLEGPTDVEWLAFHSSGTVLLAGSSSDGTVWMYHVASKTPQSWSCLQVLVGHAGTVTAGGFTPDGKWAVTIGADGSLRIWAPKTGVARHVISFAQHNENETSGLTCLALGGTADSATSKLVLVGAEDGSAHVVHVGTGKILHSLRHYETTTFAAARLQDDNDEDEEMVQEEPRSVEAVAFCPSNPLWCATGGMDGTLKIWDLTAGQVRQVCRVDIDSAADNDDATTAVSANGGITQLAWHDTLPIVFTATTTGVVRLWDARNGALVTSLTTGGSATINAMQVVFLDETKAIVITASDDHAARLFDVNVPAMLQAVNR